MNQDNGKSSTTHSDFADHVHSYLCQFILAADQKAAFTLAASSAVLGFLITRFNDSDHPDSTCAWIFGIVGASFLVVAGGLATWSLKPIQNGLKDGLVAWGGISRQKSADEYIKAVHGSDLNIEVLTHCYALSAIVRKKYNFLQKAVHCFMVGSVATIVYLVLTVAERHAR